MKTTRFIQALKQAGLVTSVGVLLSGCAGMRYHDEGMKLLSEGKQEEGLSSLKKATQIEPTNGEFRMDMMKAKIAYAADLSTLAETALQGGKVAEARELFNQALKFDPDNPKAIRGSSSIELDVRSARLVSDSERLLAEGRLDAARKKVETALAENPSHKGARRQLAIIIEKEEKMRDDRAAKAAANSIMKKPVTLQFRDANLRMVFEALSRTTGLNVILDRDVRADLKTTIFVKDAAVEDTVDMILMQNQLEKRAINANTLFIYPATPAKQKEYQDLEVRSFQIANADVKYLQTVLKNVLKIKDVSVDERSGTLVMRDTPDAIAVAAKVIAAHDVPDPEVMLEVEVLEVSHDRLTNLGIQFPDSISLSTPTPTDGLTLGGLRALTSNDLLVSSLSLGINLKLQDTDGNILASPRIRARNKEKAKILIGDRVPIITNSVTPTSSGSSVVTGSVQYQDVGLKLEFEPQVYNDHEVGIRIALEVSSIVKEISGPSGSLAYQIGTRNANTAVRLQDGETQILGGLISTADRNTGNKVPGLGQLPVLGKLFSNNSGTDNKTEIILSITPHILRAPAVLDASSRNFFSGTEGNLRERALQLDPIGAVSMQSTNLGSVATTNRAPTGSPPPAMRSFSRSLSPPALPVPSADANPTATPEPTIRKLLPLMNGAPRINPDPVPAATDSATETSPADATEGDSKVPQ
ncbi:secretin N-terminal domain-containing protein [Rhodoferax sp.]|uniref:secretin N-terminal domain-containing protein n=1 Tax=Rhodoferax sp. TaxID=50421 RepID=UPI00283F4D7A|nr:secretin N-terminal domain-containing protein [Rhodoferax sp.]MDR3370142.1 secretin N-terminal domain-containing protein [Rhodoferax sp.]